MSNRFLTASEAAQSFLAAGHKTMAEHFPGLDKDSPAYNSMLWKVLMGATAGLFYGVTR